jgi:signal transduction histidine kinase
MILDTPIKLLRGVRRARTWPELPEGVDRPAIFVLLFWSAWIATCAQAFGLFGRAPSFGVAPVAPALVALAVIWVVLPWNPGAGWRRKLAAPAFLAGTFAVGYLTDLTGSVLFYAIVVANGVFLFGFRRGVAYAAATLPILFANVLLTEGVPGAALAATAVAVPFAVFMVGICATVVEATRSRERAQALLAELESANASLKEQAARVRELSVSEERARMAREIHDSVGHHLTVINLQLQNAQRFKERRPDGAWEKVEGARRLALEALSEVRRSVRALKPLAVDDGIGTGALAALARNFEGTGMDVAFETRGTERNLAGEAEIVLYRAMQECLTNAAKHSRARQVSTTLCFEQGGTRLVVADDGKGADEGASGRGFGLTALEERVASLGGRLTRGNRPEGGFAVEVELPDAPLPTKPFAAGRS